MRFIDSMLKARIAVLFLILSVLLSSCGGGSPLIANLTIPQIESGDTQLSTTELQSLVWDAGPHYQCAGLFNPNPIVGFEGDSADCPANSPFRDDYCIWFGSPSGECPTWYNALWEFSKEDRGMMPGWDMSRRRLDNQNIELTYFNNSKKTDNVCGTWEVGFSYSYTDNSFLRNTDRSSLKISQFDKLIFQFEAKANSFEGPIQCASWPAAYITADLVLKWKNSSRADVLGIVLKNYSQFPNDPHNANGPAGSEIFFQDCQNPVGNSERCIYLLRADKMSISELTSDYRSYAIDYSPLIQKYLKPPTGLTWSDAQITHFQVYSHANGANLAFSVKNLDVIGKRSN